MLETNVRAPRSLRVDEYVYDSRSHRYRSVQSGRYVSWQEVRNMLDRSLREAEGNMVRLSEQLRNRQISLAQWQLGIRDQIKTIHITSYALERGGWQNMTPADYARIGRLLHNPSAKTPDEWGQYQYLRRFAKDIESGKALDGHFLQRVKLYAQSGRQTYHRAEHLLMRSLGFDQERSLLNPADHCTDQEGPRGGCVEQAELGWQELGTMTPIGKRNCLANDRCSVGYRKSRTGEVWPPKMADRLKGEAT